MRRWTIAATLAAAAALPAMEMTGEPEWAARRLRPEWRMKPLDAVLAEIARAIEKPVERSEAIDAGARTRLVTYIADERITVKQALETLEANYDLIFGGDDKRLRVETPKDWRARRRRPVDLQLRDYGVFAAIGSFPGKPLGFEQAEAQRGGGGGFDLMASNEPARTRSVDPAEIAESLKRVGKLGEAGVELRARGNMRVQVTPEEELAMRAQLAERYARLTRRAQIRVTFGSLPGAERFPTGLLAQAEGRALAQRLHQASALQVSAFQGQRVSAEDAQARSYVQGLEVVNAQLDPVIGTMRVGRALDVTPVAGSFGHTISYRFSWCDDAAKDRVAEFVQSAGGDPGTVSVKSKSASSAGEAEKDGQKPQSDGETEATVSGPTQLGERKTRLDLPEVWSWSPRGDVLIPSGQTFVLSAPRGSGHAVIVCEVLP